MTSGWIARSVDRFGAAGMPARAAAIAVVLALPALGVGFQVDDHVHRWILRGCPGAPDLALPPWALFTFADGDPARARRMMDLGVFPWWTFDGVRLALFRPLTALTHIADHALWPGSAPAMHAHGLAWFGALVAAAAWLYRRTVACARAAALGSFFFAVDDAHGIPAGWVANRNALLAGVAGVVAIAVHDRWRRDGWRPGAVLAPAAFCAGLLCGEAAIGALAYLVAHALYLDPADRRGRAAAVAPYVGIVVLWRIAYQRMGYGAYGSVLYVDPARDPVKFAVAAVERLPLLVGGQWAPIPIDFALLVPAAARAAMWVAAIGTVAAVAWLLAPLCRRDAEARFFAAGMTMAAVPVCASLLSARLLVFVGLGAMPLAALAVEAAWRRDPAARPGRAGQAAAAFLLAVHGVLAPALLPLGAARARLVFGVMNEAMVTIPRDPAVAGADLVVVAAPDPYSAGFVRIARAVDGVPAPARVRRLASSVEPIRMDRPDERTLVLRAERGTLGGFDGPMVRDPAHAMRAGDRVELGGLRIEVLEADPGGLPRAASFRFDVPLEDPRLRWVTWSRRAYVPFSVPPPGAAMTLAPAVPW